MFVHAASSSGLDHSPGIAEIAEWEALAGFAFLSSNGLTCSLPIKGYVTYSVG